MNTDNTNNVSTSNDVEIMTATAQTIFNTINSITNDMKDGERMTVEELANKVSKTVSMDVKVVLGFINFFALNSNASYITRGAHGGYVKGQKPVKVVKAGKKSKSETV